MDYLMLGRSGLAVSRICLGAMTFGQKDWGVDADASAELIRAYLDQGGNFIDTADGYGGGDSERFLGALIEEGALRDRVVLATKYSTNSGDPNPNAGGNGRKNASRALEGSLRRLRTDYVDLYWMHCWDQVTPVEEVVQLMDAFVRAGKIRYYGLSNVPAWYAARAVTIAETSGMAAPIALQLEYSLVERSIEREHLPASRHLGLGLCCYSPLGAGVLTGKYRPDGQNADGRLGKGAFGGLARTQREGFWTLLEAVEGVAADVGRTAAEVALNWVAGSYPSTSVIIGATRPAQLASNLAALQFDLTAEQRARLDAASALTLGTPYHFAHEPLRTFMFGPLPRPQP